MSSVILLEKVSVRYRIPRERIGSLKEYAIRRLKRRLHFDEFEALRELSLEVSGGESVGVVGRNGAGKSTLLRLIARVMPPSAGPRGRRGPHRPSPRAGSRISRRADRP